MSKLGHAIAIAADVHKDQLDKGDEAYMRHIWKVMERAGERYLAVSDGYRVDDIEIVAVLHDTLEDFDGPDHEKIRLGDRIYSEFGSEVYSAIDALTKHRGEKYEDYIERVSRNWMARIVKLADLSHNLEAWRIPSADITEKDFARWNRYHRAFVRLMREGE